MKPEISIIIITHNRTVLLERCINSISNSALPERHELIVIMNGGEKDTFDLLQSLSAERLNLRFYSIDRSSNGKARNEGIGYAKGEILYFLDDDVTVDGNIFQETINKFKQYRDVDIIGGPNLTPPQSTLLQQCSGHVFSSVFGSAGMRYRYKKMSFDRLVDDSLLILCNLAIRQKIFEKEKLLFSEKLVCNEENLLLQQLRLKGHKMLYSPALIVYHDRRKTFRELFKQIFKYGKGRMQQTLQLPSSIPFFAVLPSIFFLYIISLITFHKPLYLLPLFIYLILDIFFSLQIFLNDKKTNTFPLSLALFPLVHISYGVGMLHELIEFPIRHYKLKNKCG